MDDEKTERLVVMTKEQIKEARDANISRYKQVLALKKKSPELPIKDACKQIGWTFGQFYKIKNDLKTKYSPKKNKQKSVSKISVTEILAATPSKTPMAFMLFGPPAVLAEFARSYE